MNPDLETIENYLTGQLTSDQRTKFEEALRTDPEVADALAFYVLSKQVAHDEALAQRRAELNALRNHLAETPSEAGLSDPIPPVQSFWSVPMRWAAAASVILVLGLAWYFISQPAPSPVSGQFVDQYVAAHFNQLPITMDGGASGSTSLDSLKLGVGLFNKGQLAAAETVFHGILTRYPDMDSALKYAGIVSLRQGHYDQAIEQFHRLSERTDLFANPGPFYEAIAHLKRGQPQDKEEAEKLLNQVITRNLDGKREAIEWLKQLTDN